VGWLQSCNARLLVHRTGNGKSQSLAAVEALARTDVGSGQAAVGSGQAAVGSGQAAVGSGQAAVGEEVKVRCLPYSSFQNIWQFVTAPIERTRDPNRLPLHNALIIIHREMEWN
jgi:hypothetical protein